MPIVLRNITKSFGDERVLSSVSYTFPDASVTLLVGASGSGKTTLANIMLGLVRPDSGDITGMDGLTCSAVFQEDRLIEHYTALQNVMLVTKNSDEENAKKLLADLDLPIDGKRVHKYSGGMRRRVAIARALIVNPQFIVLDEPLNGLDETLKQKTIDVIRAHTQNAIVALITHETVEWETMPIAGRLDLARQ